MSFNWGRVDWGSVAGAAAQLGSAYMGAQASKDAGKTAAAGSDAAAALQGQIYQDQQRLNQPFYNSQVAALNQYNALMGLPQQTATVGAAGGNGPQTLGWGQPVADPAQAYLQSNPDVAASGMDPLQHYNRYGRAEGRQWGAPAQSQAPAAQPMSQQQAFSAFRNTPGYQFGLDEGRKTLESSAAASGGLFSGKAGKALVQFGRDYADQQGFAPHMNRIAAAAGIGQTNPVGSLTGIAGRYGENAGGLMQNAANSRASGLLGSADAWQEGIGGTAYFANKFGQNQGWWK